MLTFTDQQNLYQTFTQDYSAAGLVIGKRDINEGAVNFLSRLFRKIDKEYRTASLVANQQFYQFPADVLRMSEVRVLNGTNWYTPTLITSEAEWNQRNIITFTGNYPTYYYPRGSNEIGFLPIPVANLASAIKLSFDPNHIDLTQDDFIAGTVIVSNGSVTVTHSATGFTQNMVGRWLQITDGTDGKWYRIATYVSTSVVQLENFYEGIGGSGRTFRIGEVVKIPMGYQIAPVYFAAERFYMVQNDQRTAPIYHNRYEDALKTCRQTYAHTTSRMGVRSKNNTRRPDWRYLTPPIVYP